MQPKKAKSRRLLYFDTRNHQAILGKEGYVTGSSAKLDYSKDNYLFTVQAVDEDVHESLRLFPKVGR